MNWRVTVFDIDLLSICFMGILLASQCGNMSRDQPIKLSTTQYRSFSDPFRFDFKIGMKLPSNVLELLELGRDGELPDSPLTVHHWHDTISAAIIVKEYCLCSGILSSSRPGRWWGNDCVIDAR
jgi:hypothetical protein